MQNINAAQKDVSFEEQLVWDLIFSNCEWELLSFISNVSPVIIFLASTLIQRREILVSKEIMQITLRQQNISINS